MTGPLLANKTSGWRGDDHEAASNFYVVADTLTSGSHPNSNRPGRRREDDTNIVAFHPDGGGAKSLAPTGDATPGTGFGNNAAVAIAIAHGVRRLTPVECERLQGFPDGWTDIPGMRCPDSRRYAAMGDAVTVNVAEWIGLRIMRDARLGRPPEHGETLPHENRANSGVTPC